MVYSLLSRFKYENILHVIILEHQPELFDNV